MPKSATRKQPTPTFENRWVQNIKQQAQVIQRMKNKNRQHKEDSLCWIQINKIIIPLRYLIFFINYLYLSANFNLFYASISVTITFCATIHMSLEEFVNFVPMAVKGDMIGKGERVFGDGGVRFLVVGLFGVFGFVLVAMVLLIVIRLRLPNQTSNNNDSSIVTQAASKPKTKWDKLDIFLKKMQEMEKSEPPKNPVQLPSPPPPEPQSHSTPTPQTIQALQQNLQLLHPFLMGSILSTCLLMSNLVSTLLLIFLVVLYLVFNVFKVGSRFRPLSLLFVGPAIGMYVVVVLKVTT